MALSKAESAQVQTWAEKVEAAASWHTGARARILGHLAGEMRQVANGEVKASELQTQPEAPTEPAQQ